MANLRPLHRYLFRLIYLTAWLTLHRRIMAPRLQLEKAAWRWVESVKPEEIRQEHIELAYRVNLPACKRGTCRYNINIYEQHASVVLACTSKRIPVADVKCEGLIARSAEGC